MTQAIPSNFSSLAKTLILFLHGMCRRRCAGKKRTRYSFTNWLFSTAACLSFICFLLFLSFLSKAMAAMENWNEKKKVKGMIIGNKQKILSRKYVIPCGSQSRGAEIDSLQFSGTDKSKFTSCSEWHVVPNCFFQREYSVATTNEFRRTIKMSVNEQTETCGLYKIHLNDFLLNRDTKIALGQRPPYKNLVCLFATRLCRSGTAFRLQF